MNRKILKDNISLTDKFSNAKHDRTLWTKTQIIGGYGLHTNKNGISELDEVIFTTENMVPIGGVQYAMEMIYGIRGPIEVPTLNSIGIGAQSSAVEPTGGMPYAYGQKVCLFGVGVGGASDNNLSALEVKYNEHQISDIVPLRYTDSPLTEIEKNKYFGLKNDGTATAYYLKRFDADPVIHHLYKDGEDGEDGSEVDSSVYSSTNDIGIETFTECLLTITKKDVREWFAAHGNIEEARVNSIALFTGVYDADLKDYANIKLFSKLNIPTEPLSLTKDMNIVYRVYGS